MLVTGMYDPPVIRPKGPGPRGTLTDKERHRRTEKNKAARAARRKNRK